MNADATIKPKTKYPKSKKKASPRPPKRVKTYELFSFLNIWDADPEKKALYLEKFKGYLERKKEEIALEEVEGEMKKPDFIRFFKYLREKSPEEEVSTDEEDKYGYSAQERRRRYRKVKAKDRHRLYLEQQEKFPELPETFLKRKREAMTHPEEEVETVAPEDYLIVQHFFRQFEEDVVDKEVLTLALLDNAKFTKVFDINPLTVEYHLRQFPSESSYGLTCDEFTNFVLYPQYIVVLEGGKERASRTHSPSLPLPGKSCIQEQHPLVQLGKDIYEELSLTGPVSSSRMAKCMRQRFETKQYLLSPIFAVENGRHITFDKMLHEMEIYYLHNQSFQLHHYHDLLLNYRPLGIPGKYTVNQYKLLTA